MSAQTIRALLGQLYPPSSVEALYHRIEARLATVTPRPPRASSWSASDILLITYADAIQAEGRSPLQALRAFLQEELQGLITQVHLLPFFPFTSDDGFAVSDYRAVDTVHGDWSDIEALSEDVELVFDLVINHASSAHPHFQDFLQDRAPGRDYFFTADADEDVSGVTRPRAKPLLQAYETASGTRHVWCTFSRDQVDWDFSNPDVLYEFIDIFVTYIERGACWVRLDAIAYLYKVLGTPCIHLPQTHAVVKLLRVIAAKLYPDFKILTETNVPLEENLSYFGEGDEAHIVYNFSLPPLLTHALVSGDGSHLTRWCQSLPELPPGCTYLNFTASHDGIGLRPVEGLLDAGELGQLLDCVQEFGGRLTQRSRPDGSVSPYEANISLFDALKGTVAGEDAWQVERFLCSQALMLSMAGVPALYYNSVLAAPNDLEGVAETGRNRTINRRKWSAQALEAHLAAPQGAPRRVLEGLRQMMRVRRELEAFHPEAPQRCLELDPRLFVLQRGDASQSPIVCLFNLSDKAVSVDKHSLGLSPSDPLIERLTQGAITDAGDTLRCAPYAFGWLQSPQ